MGLYMKRSPLLPLSVKLGRTAFQLLNLDQTQRQLLSTSWGPFSPIESDSSQSHSFSHLDEWLIDFKLGPPPKSCRPHYQRLHDVSIELDLKTKQVMSWIDGSLGAIEATLQIILQWSLHSRGGLLVHASAGIYQGCGILVPGESGAGKSTVAREAGFDRVLSDEMVIIEREQSTPSTPNSPYRLYSSPFWSEGRTLPIIRDSAPLRLIAFPHQSTFAKLSPCSEVQAVSQLLRAVTVYERQDRNEQAHHQLTDLFEITCHLCTVTPHANLAFPKRGPWADSVFGQILT
jgi:hypothetical protein